MRETDWRKGMVRTIHGSEAGGLLRRCLDAVHPILERHLGSSEIDLSHFELQDGATLKLKSGQLVVSSERIEVDPWGGGVDWSERLESENVPGLMLEIRVENVIWSHTELRITLRASNPKLHQALQQALQGIVDTVALGTG